MAREDALFRVLRPHAEALLDRTLECGDLVDTAALANRALNELSVSINIDAYRAVLLPRLTAALQERLRRRERKAIEATSRSGYADDET
jgi:hypothetical protein